MIEVTGAQLHAARVLAGLSRQELADRAHVSRDTIGVWERSSHAAVVAKGAPLNRTVEALQVAGVTFTPGGVDRVRPSVTLPSAATGVVRIRPAPTSKILRLAPRPRVASRRLEKLSGLANGRAGLLPPPALGERRYCSLARRLLALDRRAVGSGRRFSESWVL